MWAKGCCLLLTLQHIEWFVLHKCASQELSFVHSNKYLGCTRSHRCGLGTCAWLYSTLVQPPCRPVAEQLFVLLLRISTYSSTYL